MAGHVHQCHGGQFRPAKTAGQHQMAIGAAAGQHLRFNGRGGGGEDDRQVFHAPAHHRHVAGVIMHALFLLEAGFVCFIDDDGFQVRIGQEQRRSRAHHHLGAAIGNRGPGGAALAGFQIRMPRERLAAEAGGKARQPRRGERDFRHHHQRLPAVADRLRDGFEIDFGLAGPGHAFQQDRREFARIHSGDQFIGHRLLIGGQRGRCKRRVRFGRGGIAGHAGCNQRAGGDESANHSVRNAGHAGQIARGALPPLQPLQRLGAFRGQPLRHRAAQPVFGELPRTQERHRRPRHAHHRLQRRDIIIGGPFDQAAQRLGQRRQVESRRHWAQFACWHLWRGQPIGIPHHSDDATGSKRHFHRVTRLQHHAGRYSIIQRPQPMLERDDADTR